MMPCHVTLVLFVFYFNARMYEDMRKELLKLLNQCKQDILVGQINLSTVKKLDVTCAHLEKLTSDFFVEIPHEILLIILDYGLSLRDYFAFSTTCKRNYEILVQGSNSHILRALVEKRWGKIKEMCKTTYFPNYLLREIVDIFFEPLLNGSITWMTILRSLSIKDSVIIDMAKKRSVKFVVLGTKQGWLFEILDNTFFVGYLCPTIRNGKMYCSDGEMSCGEYRNGLLNGSGYQIKDKGKLRVVSRGLFDTDKLISGKISTDNWSLTSPIITNNGGIASPHFSMELSLNNGLTINIALPELVEPNVRGNGKAEAMQIDDKLNAFIHGEEAAPRCRKNIKQQYPQCSYTTTGSFYVCRYCIVNCGYTSSSAKYSAGLKMIFWGCDCFSKHEENDEHTLNNEDNEDEDDEDSDEDSEEGSEEEEGDEEEEQPEPDQLHDVSNDGEDEPTMDETHAKRRKLDTLV